MPATAALLFTIVVRFYANTPAELATIAEARAIATDLFARAGVTATWVVCYRDDSCSRPVEGDVLVRFLLSPRDGSRHCGSAAGTGLVPSGMVTLFTRCLDEGVERLGVPHRVIAGYSLVHEIGHLLFRHGHAMRGLMAAEPDWRYATSGGLQFSRPEVAAIHAALARSAPERAKRLAAAAEEKAAQTAVGIER